MISLSLSLYLNNYAPITTKFLNSLKLGGGFLFHDLCMCKIALIVLLCNVDPKHGLCNGMRLICKELHNRVIEANIISRSHARDMVFIQRIHFIIGFGIGFSFEMWSR